MASIDLIEGGLICTTSFETPDGAWVFSPDGPPYVAGATGGGLELNPGAFAGGTILALYREATPPYVIEAEFDYTPVNLADGAGLVLWASQDQAIYLSLVTGGRQYTRLRLAVDQEERCEAYAFSPEVGAWEAAGAAFIPPGMLPGLYAEGQTAAVVRSALLARGTDITVAGLPAGYATYVLDAQGNYVAHAAAVAGAAVIQVGRPLLSFEGTIRVVDEQGNTAAETGSLALCGGDVYWYNAHDLVLLLDGEPVVPGQEIDLGSLVGGRIERRLEIVNAGEVAVSDITVRCALFNTRYGPQWVRLAPELDGSPAGYSGWVAVSGLGPRESAACWLKIERPADLPYYPYTDHHFCLLITVGSTEG